MEHKTIYTRHAFCTKCDKYTPHYVQHESDNIREGKKTITIKTSCIVHEAQALKETRTIEEGEHYLLMADMLRPIYNQQTL
jgi:hypothetical protein